MPIKDEQQKIKDYNKIKQLLVNLYNEIKTSSKLNETDRANLKLAIKNIIFYCIEKTQI